MKIAVVSSGLGHVARGIETWADDLATALHRRGINVTLFKGGGTASRSFERVVCCAQRDRRVARCLAASGKRFFWRYGFGSPYAAEQTTFAWSLVFSLRSSAVDIVHLQDPWLALLLERTKWFHHAKVILAHGTEEPVEFLQQFQHVQELSPSYLERHRNSGARQWFAIPNFVDVDRFRPQDRRSCLQKLGLSTDDFLVLSVGALRRTCKRMDWLVEEFAQLTVPHARLVIAGAREDETTSFIEQARVLVGADRLLVLENLPRDRMPELYCAADVFVLCSLEEILGIAFLEAMACGVPCIGHTYPVTQWVIGPGGDCINMEERGALQQQLTRYINYSFRETKALAVRQHVVAMFSEEVVVNQIVEMYRKVLKHSR
jgi:glycosyltransferase involved in cell wall biosynthesis